MTIRNNKMRVLYDQNETPHEVYSLSAFCQEHNLNLTSMQNVIKGRTRQHRGWHLDEARTRKDHARAASIRAAINSVEGLTVRFTQEMMDVAGLEGPPTTYRIKQGEDDEDLKIMRLP